MENPGTCILGNKELSEKFYPFIFGYGNIEVLSLSRIAEVLFLDGM